MAKRTTKKTAPRKPVKPAAPTLALGRDGQRDDGHIMEVGTFRMSGETRRHLKSYAHRVKLTQGELLRRFIARLPRRRDKLVKEVSVPVMPV